VVVGGPVAGRLGFACNARKLFCSILRTKRWGRRNAQRERERRTRGGTKRASREELKGWRQTRREERREEEQQQ
jgi:hypothetical protein